MRRNVIIFGANGMIGSYLWAYLSSLREDEINVIPLNRHHFDARSTQVDKLEDLLVTLNVDQSFLVINAIGLIPQAAGVSESFSDRDYLLINSIFPQLLASLCSKYQAAMIQISTDCVFSGIHQTDLEKNHYVSYNELSLCDEDTIYGLSKSLGEPSYDLCGVIRVSVIGEEIKRGRSLLEWVLSHRDLEECEHIIKGYSNHFWNGITCLQLAEIIEKVMRGDKFWKGVRHIFSTNSISKYQLIKLIAKEYGIKSSVIPIDQHVAIDKSLSTIFDLNAELEIPDIESQLTRMHQFNLKHRFSVGNYKVTPKL